MDEFLEHTFTKIEVSEDKREVRWYRGDGVVVTMHHRQDCCEDVWLEDVCGDIEDLVGAPIVVAECSTNKDMPAATTEQFQDTYTWTFYKFRTSKGDVTLRWFGTSSGYYSEDVDIKVSSPGRLMIDFAIPRYYADHIAPLVSFILSRYGTVERSGPTDYILSVSDLTEYVADSIPKALKPFRGFAFCGSIRIRRVD